MRQAASGSLREAPKPATVAEPPEASELETLPESVTAPLETIEPYLRGFVQRAPLPENLREAVGYALLGPGKRIRPLLVWHCAVAAAGSDETGIRALPAACAIELIHAFSLVHDDLPGMDDDDLRRGRPTLHRHTSEAMAILAGDVMLTLAFSALDESEAGEDDGLVLRLSRELAGATSAMIAGQVYDTLGGFPPGADDRQRLRLVHENKTGALIRASCRMGAMAGLRGSMQTDTLERLSKYGDDIGLMFQIVDDLLDVTQTTAHLGKRAGKDEEAGKLTWPGVAGVEASRDEVRRLKDDALGALEPLGDAAEPLRGICRYLATRTR